MIDKFYVAPWHFKCSVHDKPVSHQVKTHDGGVLYRYACSQSCAEKQRAELEKAWEDKTE
jgi:hypothetical protein